MREGGEEEDDEGEGDETARGAHHAQIVIDTLCAHHTHIDNHTYITSPIHRTHVTHISCTHHNHTSYITHHSYIKHHTSYIMQ